MNLSRILFSFLLLMAVPCAFGQDILRSGGGDPSPVLTGNLHVDMFGLPSPVAGIPTQTGEETAGSHGHKSPWLAAGMSLLIPGSGELYSESYWKAAAFFAVGVTAWTFAYLQNKKGDDQTEFFQGYANQNWSVNKYAQWTLDNATNINPAVTPSDYAVFGTSGQVNWAELNRLERDLGNWYSHTLPPYGEQQYYELIGKYPQFYQGWGDADPSLNTYDAVKSRLNQGNTQFTYYSDERGKANDYYNTSHTAVTIAVVTHVVSAVDGAWSASSYNNQFEAGVGFLNAPDGPVYVSYPAFVLSYKF